LSVPRKYLVRGSRHFERHGFDTRFLHSLIHYNPTALNIPHIINLIYLQILFNNDVLFLKLYNQSKQNLRDVIKNFI